jgi:hypothetical protein
MITARSVAAPETLLSQSSTAIGTAAPARRLAAIVGRMSEFAQQAAALARLAMQFEGLRFPPSPHGSILLSSIAAGLIADYVEIGARPARETS